MERPSARRPLPALAFLIGLSLLTALVWWRVIHRADSGHSAAKSACPTPTNSVVPRPTEVQVQVLNSTTRNHLAHDVASAMQKIGFRITGIGNDDPGVVVSGVAEIRYGPKGSSSATLLSFYLPGATLVPTQRSDSAIVVSLGTKFKSVATTTQAKRTMASQHVTQAPARPRPLGPTPTPTATATPTC